MSSESGQTMSRRDRPLYRDTSDKMVAGVCSGLAHYFDIHTTLVRVAFVVFTLLGGAGVLAYLVLWIALKPGPTGYHLETKPEIFPEDQTEPEALPDSQPPSDLHLDDIDELPSEIPAEEPPVTEP